MALLERFSPPANLTELSEKGLDGWSKKVSGFMEKAKAGGDLDQFFNPLKAEGDPANLAARAVKWTAFPATLIKTGDPNNPQRWREADASRDVQDEYCEWSVKRDGGEITRVTFTTETPDYFEQLLETDEELLLDLYEELTGRRPEIGDLVQGGTFNRENDFNRDDDGGIAHLSQGSNNLWAAIALVAQATVLRENEKGEPVTDQSELIKCGKLGEARRNSDPQIAGAINRFAAEGQELSLADPAGLYIDEFISAGITTPDGTDAGEFWKVTRGSEEQALRAVFEVPTGKGYSVGKLEIDGRPIETGAQLADHVRIRVTALTRPGDHQAVRQPCVG